MVDGDCIVSLLCVVLGVIIGISFGKTDGDKVGCWLGRILATLINTLLGNCEGISLYWSSNTYMCTEGLMHAYWGWYWNGNWEDQIDFVKVIN